MLLVSVVAIRAAVVALSERSAFADKRTFRVQDRSRRL
jgi:hypothetical protein